MTSRASLLTLLLATVAVPAGASSAAAARPNGLLSVVARKDVNGLVPPRVYRRFRSFKRCRDCRRVYWRGTHFARLQRLVAELRSA